MSRCFPYPPPGYTLSRTSNDALIESIKLQKEREKARAEKKKDRKKEKKQRKKEQGKEEKAKRKASNISYDVYGVLEKVGKEENGQLERSGITEELELPVNSQNPSTSSDSTQNSNKRKRHESPLKNGHTGGNILRFWLPSQKHMKCKLRNDVDEFQATSGRTDSSSQNENVWANRAQLDKVHPVSLAADSTLQLVPVGHKKESCQVTQQTSCSDSLEKHHDHVSKKSKKQYKSTKKYAKLIDFVPPRQSNDIVDNDEEWLHWKNPQELNGKIKTNNQMSCANSCLLWPGAQYLREADIFALPFSVPF